MKFALFGTGRALSLVAGALLAGSLGLGCGSTEDVVGGEGDLLVSGTVERESTANTDNTALTHDADNHVVITLRRYEGEDAGATLVVEIDEPVRDLPFNFEVRGDAAAAFGEARTELLVSVTVFQHAGTDLRVGDLTSETRSSVRQAGETLRIAVGGLEACGSANAGGFCVGE